MPLISLGRNGGRMKIKGKEVVGKDGKCLECHNNATSPVGDEKYCYSH